MHVLVLFIEEYTHCQPPNCKMCFDFIDGMDTARISTIVLYAQKMILSTTCTDTCTYYLVHKTSQGGVSVI